MSSPFIRGLLPLPRLGEHRLLSSQDLVVPVAHRLSGHIDLHCLHSVQLAHGEDDAVVGHGEGDVRQSAVLLRQIQDQHPLLQPPAPQGHPAGEGAVQLLLRGTGEQSLHQFPRARVRLPLVGLAEDGAAVLQTGGEIELVSALLRGSAAGPQQEQQPQQPQQETPRLSKEEYAAMRKAEREELQARVDAQAQEVFRDDASMKGFLNFMAQCTPQSTRNLLILYEQDPTITHPRTFDKWKEAGRSLRSGVTGYAFYADQEYEREDGTKGSGFTITKAFDISQTRGQQPLPSQQRLPEEIIAALVEQSPVPLAISDQLPQGVQAQYVPKQRTIYVRNGMDETATICAIAREQAHAGFDTVGSGYYRQAYAPQAYCAAYVVAQKLGLDTSAFHFDKVCQTCAGMEVQEKKGFISDVKRAAYAINRDMQRSFREMEQAIQPDEFSVEPPKPAKAPKAKEDKEKEAAR